MKRVALIGVLFALGACGAPDPNHSDRDRTDARYVPSTDAVGVFITGYATIGVSKEF